MIILRTQVVGANEENSAEMYGPVCSSCRRRFSSLSPCLGFPVAVCGNSVIFLPPMLYLGIHQCFHCMSPIVMSWGVRRIDFIILLWSVVKFPSSARGLGELRRFSVSSLSLLTLSFRFSSAFLHQHCSNVWWGFCVILSLDFFFMLVTHCLRVPVSHHGYYYYRGVAP